MKYQIIKFILIFSLITLSSQTDISKVLILFFSRPGENYSVGKVEIGNTELIANYIKNVTNADIYKINPKEKYPESYSETLIRAKNELDKNLRPEIISPLNDIKKYDIIFLGYPIWYEHLPKIVVNQLEKLDFKGKTIIPFNTHEGSEIGNSIDDIKNIVNNDCIVKNGFPQQGSFIRNNIDKMKENTLKWINQNIGMKKNQNNEL